MNPIGTGSDTRVVLIDYGMGNLGSIINMLKKIGVLATVARDATEVDDAGVLILPGVGAFDTGMENIERLGLLEVLNRKACVERAPVLGICLGMQLITRGSEEGTRKGLGWIAADTVRFRFSNHSASLKVPHIGWNRILPTVDSPLFQNLHELRAYFVHSFHLVCDRRENVLAWTHYGYNFPSMVVEGNVYGMQFHPEKSHKYGMRLLENFFLSVGNA